MRGFAEDTINLDNTRKVLEHVNKITEGNPEFTIIAGYEYTSPAKIDSVPESAMPFPRHHSLSNGFLVFTWKNNTAENLAYAQRSAQEILDIIAKGQGHSSGTSVNIPYGNFGKGSLST